MHPRHVITALVLLPVRLVWSGDGDRPAAAAQLSLIDLQQRVAALPASEVGRLRAAFEAGDLAGLAGIADHLADRELGERLAALARVFTLEGLQTVLGAEPEAAGPQR